MPLKSHKYDICPKYLTCIYGGNMPIYMPCTKLVSLMMYPESLYTDNDDATARLHIPSHNQPKSLATWLSKLTNGEK